MLNFFLLICSGATIGISSALWMSGLIGPYRPAQATTVTVENWVADWAIGTSGTTAYMRTYVARRGLLALPKSEAVYFIRTVDDEGQPLTENCIYQVSGGPQQARWWSLTLYDDNDFLPANDDGAYSVDQTKMGPKTWSAYIQPTAPNAVSEDKPIWLSSRNAGKFDLMLRLYKPTKALLSMPNKTVNPPSIQRLTCKGGDI